MQRLGWGLQPLYYHVLLQSTAGTLLISITQPLLVACIAYDSPLTDLRLGRIDFLLRSLFRLQWIQS